MALSRFGMAIVTMMPMIATTIKSSISVKPLLFLYFMEINLLVPYLLSRRVPYALEAESGLFGQEFGWNNAATTNFCRRRRENRATVCRAAAASIIAARRPETARTSHSPG